IRLEAGEVEQEPAEAIGAAGRVGVGAAELVRRQLLERREDVGPVVEELGASVGTAARVASERAFGIDAVDDEDLAHRQTSGAYAANVSRSRQSQLSPSRSIARS